MYSDKEKAKQERWRTPEATLWRIAMLGGAIGSYIGMKMFRHKTKHRLFAIGFPLLAVLQIGSLCYLVFKLHN